jgi:hypothetical protein
MKALWPFFTRNAFRSLVVAEKDHGRLLHGITNFLIRRQ